jgi:beta-N-acetylhexosaminidase
MSDSIYNLPVEQKIGQLFFIGVQGTTVDDRTDALLTKIQPGGICLFARNIREASQTRELLALLKRHVRILPFLSLDQEGGLVDRLRRIITPMPAANSFRDVVTASRFGAIVAETIRILGFNMDFAPVVDVIDEKRETPNNGMLSRAFGRNENDVVSLAGAFLESLQSNGCLGCVKHFPGLGSTAVDSHEKLPTVDITEKELRQRDLVPYQQLLDRKLVHAVMVAHAAYPNTGLQEKGQNGTLLPSSLSRRIVTDLLRNEMQFNGLVITDDLEMGAIVKNFGVGEACVMAVEAGVDMLAICASAERINEGFDSVLAAVKSGRVSEDRVDESLSRIDTARALLQEPLEFNTQRLAELSDMVAWLNDSLRAETRP